MKNATNEKARRTLGWAPRSNEESIVATAESLVRLSLLKDSPKKGRLRISLRARSPCGLTCDALTP